jgi:2-oxoglutarate dehydrogenase E1 component
MDQDSVLESLLSALGMNAGFVVDAYERYRNDPVLVSPEWRRYFAGLERGEPVAADVPGGSGTSGNGAPAGEIAGQPATSPDGSAAVGVLLDDGDRLEPLRGGKAVIVRNMEASRAIPTATSYRTIPVRLLEENRALINHQLRLSDRGKISYTHLIAWAIARALSAHRRLNDCFTARGGVPQRVVRAGIHLGVAVDLAKKDGSRALVVPNIRNVEALDFASFVEVYNRTIDRARTGGLQPEDFAGTTISLTNPGTVGTAYSVPRLMAGQGAIIATGVIDYPAENRAMAREVLSELGVSRSMTVSCTYDHRIIQGAESGEFLATVEGLMRGEDGFYDRIFRDLKLPYRPIRWRQDHNPHLSGGGSSEEAIIKHGRVLRMINAYRVRGHLIADLDPLGDEPQYHPELDPEFYDLTMWDWDRKFIIGDLLGTADGSLKPNTLREILDTLRATYCGRIGVEYMNIQDPEQKRWLQERMEPTRNSEPLAPERKHRLLQKLIRSHAFEKFLHARFVGHKRFSLEGGETLIPILDQLLEAAAADGATECVMGMSHRGRLNVVTQTIGKAFERIFAQFEGNPDPLAPQGSGDVKYHLGATGRHVTADGKVVDITLSPNPSHLEAVDPVVEGIARAKQDMVGGDEGRRRILPVLIHGDAAFAGQGVVAETLNLSQLHGYRTGGTVHIIVNNQIGFTTPVDDARSSPYPTDVAKMGQAPIVHVNGDDPEASARAVRLAFAYRQEFHRDVVIDMFCYRRHGHNEGDEPSFTNPRMYSKIRNHAPVAELYAEKLVREGAVTAEEVEAMRKEADAELERAFARADEPSQALQPATVDRRQTAPGAKPTSVSDEVVQTIGRALLQEPPDVDVHPKLVKFLDHRRALLEGKSDLDWATAEALAFGALALEGHTVRLSGQDSARGTFSQRHMVLHDDDTDSNWIALQHVSPDQGPVYAIDSPLSEAAVLGFEYGYSIAAPEALVMWEAQFGDFVNGAQVHIDQFLAGGEAKWGQPSGVVLLLPHGYEGQGPEHSSARLERFLQLAAEDNLQVAAPTTPAQYFHLLRRQVRESVRKPLVVMTPKSLLRHARAVSPLDALTEGRFRPVIEDPAGADVTRILLCSGKVYYDLARARDEAGREDAAVIRMEQLYPFPREELAQVLERHPQADTVWVQEEPKNMGAWAFLALRFADAFPKRRLRYVGRAESASTATGYYNTHTREQERLVGEALG